MLFYFKGGFENAKKNQGGTKSGFRLLFNLKGGFQNAGKNQGGTKNAFNFQIAQKRYCTATNQSRDATFIGLQLISHHVAVHPGLAFKD